MYAISAFDRPKQSQEARTASKAVLARTSRGRRLAGGTAAPPGRLSKTRNEQIGTCTSFDPGRLKCPTRGRLIVMRDQEAQNAPKSRRNT